jgi:hypothetical protein
MPAVNQQGIKIMETFGDNTDKKSVAGKETTPTTLTGLMRVLIAKGKLTEFAQAAEVIDKTIQDPTQKTAALAELAEKYTKE